MLETMYSDYALLVPRTPSPHWNSLRDRKYLAHTHPFEREAFPRCTATTSKVDPSLDVYRTLRHIGGLEDHDQLSVRSGHIIRCLYI